ncbi:PIR Superfamily Protein [Plasmodium ovale wallikeri]|uniref:PIR Superfamily Protein n=2 Tax=Plasmodium ovale TaxID=36330 RepID=A0A1A9AGS2_PLAOA|nr:PIR Superfamily Protein [Plasmodium ovale wallikeri]SBT59196.1 PIR Superfamily Protein [Plasmodium ovale wallikeri]SBT73774.1 PIR protein [Plasmodium ovale]
MSTSALDPILQKLDNEYPILRGLPLFRIYNKIDSYSMRKPKDSICSHHINKSFSHSDSILSVCENVENIFINSNSILALFPEVNINKYCKHLNFYIYEKIKNITTENNYEEFYKALNEANIKYILNHDNCNITNFKNNEEGYNKKKELFFRSEILQWIKIKYDKTFSGDETFCNNYLKDCAKFYNENIKNEYCKLAKLHGNEIKSFLTNFRETKKFLGDKRVNITIDDTHLPQESICAPDPEIKLSEQESNSLTSDESMISSSGHSNTEVSPVDSANSDTDKTLEILLSISTGIVLVFPILYKFTPFGTWLHNRLRANKGKIDLEAKTEEFNIDNFENEDITSYSDIYNINYHSSRNS